VGDSNTAPSCDLDPSWYRRYPQFVPGDPVGTASIFASYLDNAAGAPHLVAIYDTPGQDNVDSGWCYHIIGWALFSYQVSPVQPNGVFSITGTFQKMNLDSSYVSSGTDLQDGGNDFGVRGVALSR
jgi:hypothetical protein